MKQLFGGVIAVALLGIYVHLVRIALGVVGGTVPAGTFTGGMAQAMTVIGGLISALVIAELAITTPGQMIGARMVSLSGPPLTAGIVKVIAVVYVLIWIVTGLWAFLVGLYHPDGLAALTNLGQAWFGLAVAAAYSYFGLNPPSGTIRRVETGRSAEPAP